MIHHARNAQQICKPVIRANLEISTSVRKSERDNKEDSFLSKAEKTESNRCKKKEKAFIDIFRKEKLRKTRKLMIQSFAKQVAHEEHREREQDLKKKPQTPQTPQPPQENTQKEKEEDTH